MGNSFLPVVEKLKDAYKSWQECLRLFPKTSKHSLGMKIDTLFVEVIEATVTAVFLQRELKQPWIKRAIIKIDTLKVLLQISWEIKFIDNKKFIILSEQLSEIGRQLGGWHNQIVKQNSPSKNIGEK